MPANEHTIKPELSEPTNSAQVHHDVCPECDGTLATDEVRGETTCSDCGLVVSADHVDPGPEWRSFEHTEGGDRRRVGAPLTKLRHDEGLTTSIGWGNRDAKGRMLDPNQRRRVQRLRRWNNRFHTTDWRERNLRHALGEIDRMAGALGLPQDVRETAGVIYRRALEEDLLPGRSIEGMATAVLYGAARMANAPRSLDEMVAVSRVGREEIGRTYRYVVRELSLEIEPADPGNFIPRLASSLEISEEAERRAFELLRVAKTKQLISGKSPTGLAAAAVYAACRLTNERVTQAAVGEVANISEVTIRHRYHELLEADGRPI